MVTLNISAGVIFFVGVITGVILSAVGLFTYAIVVAKNNMNMKGQSLWDIHLKQS